MATDPAVLLESYQCTAFFETFFGKFI